MLRGRQIQLNLKSDEYKSIKHLNSETLPNLVVLTGKNGVGKSHLLEAIAEGSVTVSGIDPARISLVTQSDFTKPRPKEMADRNAYQSYKSQKINSLSTMQSQLEQQGSVLGKTEQEKLREIAKEQHTTIYKISEGMIHAGSLKRRYTQYISKVNQLLRQHKNNHSFSYVREIYEKGDEFFQNIDGSKYISESSIAGVFSKGVIPEQLAVVIFEYAYRYKKNELHIWQNEKKGGKYDVLTDEQFVDSYGSPPWELINSLLEKFPDFKYKLHFELDSFDPDESRYELYFVNHTSDTVKLYPENLSSGEKTILSIVLSIFSAGTNSEFPELLLLDEVDAALHPSMCTSFISAVNEVFCIDNDIPVMIVTHSASTVAVAPNESVYVLYRDESGTGIELASKAKALKILSEGFVGITVQDNQSVILHKVEDAAKHSIVFEGESDEIYIREVIKRSNSKLGDSCSITSGDGYGGLDNVWKVLKTRMGSRINAGKKMVLVFDCDQQRPKEKHGIHAKLSIERVDANPIKDGIENLLVSSIVERLISNFGEDVIYDGKDGKEVNELYKNEIAEWVVNNASTQEFQPFIDLVASLESEYFSE